MFRVCKSAVTEGSLARCPKMARTEDGYCRIHSAPGRHYHLLEPELILVRFQLTKRLADIAAGLGVRVTERSAKRQAELDRSREREARARWGRQNGTTGTWLFGPDGLKQTRFANLPAKLSARGFVMSDAHIVYFDQTDYEHLCLSFTKSETEKEKSAAGTRFYNENLAGANFDIRGYHNPPNLSGGHDVNYSLDCQFAEGEALCELGYDGDWVAKEIVATS